MDQFNFEILRKYDENQLIDMLTHKEKYIADKNIYKNLLCAVLRDNQLLARTKLIKYLFDKHLEYDNGSSMYHYIMITGGTFLNMFIETMSIKIIKYILIKYKQHIEQNNSINYIINSYKRTIFDCMSIEQMETIIIMVLKNEIYQYNELVQVYDEKRKYKQDFDKDGKIKELLERYKPLVKMAE